MTACTRPVPAKVRTNSIMKIGGETENPDLLAIDCCCKRDNQFSLRVWILVSKPHSSGRVCIQESVGSTN